mgnify:CR=1 FL=1
MKTYNKSMLTVDLLDRFETEGFTADLFTDSEIKWIEHAAYVAMMNNHNGDTEDAYTDFFRVMKIRGINPTTNNTNDNTKEDETMTTTTTATLTNGESINTAERVLNAAEDLITATKCRSAWAKGVNVYAIELLEDLRESCTGGWFEEDDLGSARLVEKGILNGASDWTQYSWGGCSLIYDTQIAARLCTPSELKITRNGERNPNSREQWLDTQARALYQAARIVVDAVTRSYTFNA